MSTAGNSRIIPHYISAASLRELQRRMILNNMRDAIEYKYFDIQQDISNQKWVAFFYKKATGLLDPFVMSGLVKPPAQDGDQ